MQTQHVADRSSFEGRVEALESQHSPIARDAVLFSPKSGMLREGCTQVTLTSYKGQDRSFGLNLPATRDRRSRCQRALRASWFWAWSPLWRPVRHQKKKNMLWLLQNPFRWNQPLPANTNSWFSGQALRPVPSCRPICSGGVTC